MQITFGNGSALKIDDADVHLLAGRNWCVSAKGYLRSDSNGSAVFFHHRVLPRKDGFVHDHINGDTLDNRRINLRHATHAENMRNRKPSIGGSSSYKGVYRNKASSRKPWRAQVSLNGKLTALGSFVSEEAAAQAYNAAAATVHGDFSRLNPL